MHLMRSAMRLAMAVAVLATGQAVAQEIKVGGIFDLTGITSDVGKPYAQGVRDYVALTNASGGVNGKKIKLIDVDYGYKIPEAVSAYKRMKEEQVVLINGWGTGDTLALKNFINDDKIPYVSGLLRRRPDRPGQDALQLLRGPELLRPDPRLAQLGQGGLEGQDPRPQGRPLLRRQRLRQGPHAGRAAPSPRRTASRSSTRRSCPATSRTPPASSST